MRQSLGKRRHGVSNKRAVNAACRKWTSAVFSDALLVYQPDNAYYLRTKVERMRHLLTLG